MPPAGEAKPDWWLLAQVAQRLGFHEGFTWTHPAAIFREHAALSGFENNGQRAFDISGLAGISDAEWDAMKPVQWPINDRYPEAAPGCSATGTFTILMVKPACCHRPRRSQWCAKRLTRY